VQKRTHTPPHSEEGRRFRRPRPARPRRRRPECSPYCRTIAAAGFSRMPTPPRSSTLRRTTVLGSQYRRHAAATLTRMFASHAILGVKRFCTWRRITDAVLQLANNTPPRARALTKPIVPHNYLCGAEERREGEGPSQQPRRFRRSLPASSRLAELLTVLPHDRGRRLQPNADTAALIDKSALGRYPPNDIFSSQYPSPFCGHPDTHLCKQCNLWC
jgi:hypothetical protein